MKILLVDNYDSFTYNLVQLLKEAGVMNLSVVKNDMFSLREVEAFQAIVVSPGPGLPSEAGLTCDLIRHFAGKKKILGVCLGMQAIADVFGGKLVQPGHVLHGETVGIRPVPPVDKLFTGLESGFGAGLYHSWAVDAGCVPDCLRITSHDNRGVIMSLRHKAFDICGVQFHPESIMTPMGGRMIENWLKSEQKSWRDETWSAKMA